MTEDEAQGWLRSTFGADAEVLLARFVALLQTGANEQNLISATTRRAIWARHIVDSAQLVRLAAPAPAGVWADIGSGAGLPGLVVACLIDRPVVLIEPRRLRGEFLRHATATLGLDQRVSVIQQMSERIVLPAAAAVISARAVAALPALLHATEHLADQSTVWLLPKGQNATSEIANAQQSWHGAFHVQPSVTDANSGIVVAQGVCRR